MPQDMTNKIMTRNMESLENSCIIQGEFLHNSRRIQAEFSTVRLVVTLLLMMVLMVAFGTTVSWGQTTDRSGVYYIANKADNTFYLYKSTDLYTANQPYLTTLATISDDDEKAWRLQFVKTENEKDYYYIIHDKDAQYLTLNDSKTTNAASLRVHLQSKPGSDDNSLFYITGTDPYCICPKNDTENRSLAPAGANYDQANANDAEGNQEPLAADATTIINTAGLIGLGATDAALSQWKMTKADQCSTAPVIKFNYPDGTVTITVAAADVTIYYTMDGTNPAISNTRKMYDPNYLPQVSSGKKTVFKACAIQKCKDNSDVTTQQIVYNPTITITGVPEGGITYDAAVHNPTISVSVTVGETPTVIDDTEYTVSYIKDGKEYTNCKDAGIYTVALKDVDGGTYVVYGTSTTTHTINKAALTITAEGKTVNYGDDINNSVTYSGFVGGETQNTAGVLSGTLTYSYNSEDDGSGTAYTPPIPVTSCYIIPGGLTAQNYDITFVAGTLTVTPQDLNNGTNLADGYTVSVDGEGKIVLKYKGAIVDTERYTVTYGDSYDNGKYTKNNKITGKGNLSGSVDNITIANVNFVTDDNRRDWSATFVAGDATGDVGHALPEGMSAYIITSINTQEHVANTEALTYIPKGVPVLLLYGAPATGFVVNAPVTDTYTPITTTGDGNQKDKNMLELNATDRTLTSEASIYVLYKNEFVLNTTGTLPAGKVYLNPAHISSGSSGAPARLSIAWGSTTGIELIDNSQFSQRECGDARTIDNSVDYWYTLDGRRLSGKPTKKGLYINNGHLVVIK